MKSQETDGKPQFSSSHLPPDDFHLNAALSQSRSVKNKKLGVGIEGSAQSVTRHMAQLDEYLQVCDSCMCCCYVYMLYVGVLVNITLCWYVYSIYEVHI